MTDELVKLTKTYYYNSYGHYVLSDNGSWSFLAKEKYYKSEDLLNIINTLNILNENIQKENS